MSRATAAVEPVAGLYPERQERSENGFDRWARELAGGVWHRVRPLQRRLRNLAAAAARHGQAVAAMDDDAIRDELRSVARAALDDADAAGRAFALVREASGRSLGMRPYDVQLMGAGALFAGKLVEMQTGEGKTLTAALAACIAGTAGLPVHIVTVNDYLAERDAREMAPLLAFFGLRVGTVVTGMDADARRRAYACEVTYCTNKELVFDYLKDRVATSGRASRAQVRVKAWLGVGRAPPVLLRGLHFAIVDEADSVMIDEARTPLILAEKGESAPDAAVFERALELASLLERDRHYELLVANRQIHLTEAGRAALAERAGTEGGAWSVAQAREHLAAQALRALHLFQRDQHYLVAEDKVQIIDEYTGRVLPGRTWEQGLHQLIEVKEGCPISEQNRTLARITYQRFFSRYLRLAGMTGTAREVAREVWSVYGLETVAIPTNRPCQRAMMPPVCCATEAQKWERVVAEAVRVSGAGLPVLVGTRSVEASARLAEALALRGVPHRVLSARQDADEARVVAQAGQPGVVTVATNMAGRGTDIHLAPGVADRGGLCVILTEYHDSPRIDRQLIGRCARQGDPGVALAIVALDDALFRDHGGALYGLIGALFRSGPPPVWLGLLRRRAQASAEAIHARTRRDTLRQDRKLDDLLAFAGRQV